MNLTTAQSWAFLGLVISLLVCVAVLLRGSNQRWGR